jgi:glyoxylase-like metal-dependent hydrolase (beta-lactamase superfamily II)
MDGLMAVYGLEGDSRSEFEQVLIDEFHFSPRPDAQGFSDGHVFDLGGGTTVEAVHLPGHTRGHSGFRMERVFFLSDIDLTGFGPYYGDVWSDLDDFEESLRKVRNEDAEFYVTFHHKGVIEGRDAFVELLDAFHAVIGRRHDAMFDFLREPHSIDEMVAHRFIYRPNIDMPFVDSVERRSAEMHIARMLRAGDAVEVGPGRYQAV